MAVRWLRLVLVCLVIVSVLTLLPFLMQEESFVETYVMNSAMRRPRGKILVSGVVHVSNSSRKAQDAKSARSERAVPTKKVSGPSEAVVRDATVGYRYSPSFHSTNIDAARIELRDRIRKRGNRRSTKFSFPDALAQRICDPNQGHVLREFSQWGSPGPSLAVCPLCVRKDLATSLAIPITTRPQCPFGVIPRECFGDMCPEMRDMVVANLRLFGESEVLTASDLVTPTGGGEDLAHLRNHIPLPYDEQDAMELWTTLRPLLPPSRASVMRFPSTMGRCAVVGSSSILLGAGWGAYIDTYDVVWRVNMPPTVGYEVDVGHRTDIYVVNGRHFGYDRWIGKTPFVSGERSPKDNMDDSHASVMFFAYESTHLWDYVRIKNDSTLRTDTLELVSSRLVRHVLPKDLFNEFIRLYPSKMLTAHKQFYRISGGYSTGTMAVTLALLRCDQVDVFGFMGFPTDSAGITLPYHYYADDRNRPTEKSCTACRGEQSMLIVLSSLIGEKLRVFW